MSDQDKGALMALVLALLVICAAVSGAIASSKGRNAMAFAVAGFLLGPIGVLLSIGYAPDSEELARAKLSAGESKKCPQCAEIIRAEATVCRFCGASNLPLAPSHPDPTLWQLLWWRPKA